MPVSLRPIVQTDFPKLYALDQACFAPGIAWSRAELQYFMRYPGNIGILAEDKPGNIAGFAIAGKQHRKGALLGRLITIDVDPAQRRHGVGHMLLEETEQRQWRSKSLSTTRRHKVSTSGMASCAPAAFPVIISDVLTRW